MLITAALLVALQAAAAPTTVTCSVKDDPAGRVYRLSKTAVDAGWRIARRTRAQTAWIELALPGAHPSLTATSASLSYTNANGGRQVKLEVGPDHARLDVWVDYGLEVNVDPNLDPRVDELTTHGVLDALECTIDGVEERNR